LYDCRVNRLPHSRETEIAENTGYVQPKEWIVMLSNGLYRSLKEFVLLLVALACAVIIVVGIQSFSYIINSILLAGVITLAVIPLPRNLIQRGMKPSLALVISLVLILVVLVGLFVLAYNSVISYSAGLEPVDATEAAADAPATESILSRIEGLVTVDQVNHMIGTIVAGAGQVAAQFFMVLMIFIFMLSAAIATPITEQATDAFSSEDVSRLTDLLSDVQQYISITTLINAMVGLFNAVFLFILGVPLAGLWGIFSWLTGYIPSIGFWIALIPPVLIAWATQGLQTAAIVFIGYVLINGSIENFVKPRIMGEGLNVSPLIIFVSLFVWASILGGVGAILAVPLTLMILSVLDSFDATKWIVVLTKPASASDEHEKKEAGMRLKNLWNRISRRDDDDDDDGDDDDDNDGDDDGG
jgi:predicted PurR-regulated permease PerM